MKQAYFAALDRHQAHHLPPGGSGLFHPIKGHLQQIGTPQQVYSTPGTVFVARFIGTPPMNLMRLNGADIVTGVRPEDMRIGSDGLEARVETVEYLGADSLIAASLKGQALLVRVPGRSHARAGDALRLAWDKQHEHHFDSQTGGRK